MTQKNTPSILLCYHNVFYIYRGMIAEKVIKELDSQSKEKLEVYYNTFATKLVTYTLNNYQIGEDAAWNITYKTLYKLVDVLDNYSFENENKKLSFVFRVHINFIKNYFRDTKLFENANTEVELHENISDSNFEPSANESKEMQQLKKELDALPDWQRVLILMRSQGVEYKTISNYVNKPVIQLKVYYSRIKKQLKKKLLANGK